jgi:hypothetical protein
MTTKHRAKPQNGQKNNLFRQAGGCKFNQSSRKSKRILHAEKYKLIFQ